MKKKIYNKVSIKKKHKKIIIKMISFIILNWKLNINNSNKNNKKIWTMKIKIIKFLIKKVKIQTMMTNLMKISNKIVINIQKLKNNPVLIVVNIMNKFK